MSDSDYNRPFGEEFDRLLKDFLQNLDIDSNRPDKYTLLGQTPVPTDSLYEWASMMEIRGSRIVKQERVLGICWVSTVFLGLDHSFRGGPPILFETMAFWWNLEGEEQTRCTTWAEAEEMHRQMIRQVSRPSSVLAYVGRWFRKYWESACEDWRESWQELQGRDPDADSDPHWAEAKQLFRQVDRRRDETQEQKELARFGG